jgi:hypothetical protein
MPASFPDVGQFPDQVRHVQRNGLQKNIETRKRVMLRNILFTAAIVAPAILATDAMAASTTSPETGKQHARTAAHSVLQRRRRPVAHPVPPQVSVFRAQGYVYVPGKGIVGEACNLPTSACPNEMRDVQ